MRVFDLPYPEPMGHNKRYGDPLTPLDPPAVPVPPRARVRHVVVNLSNIKQAPSAYPGVIVEWRRSTTGWEAQVAYVVDVGTTATLHVTWCRGDQLTPASANGMSPADEH